MIGDRIPCPQCGSKFVSERRLEKHMLLYCKERVTENPAPRTEMRKEAPLQLKPQITPLGSNRPALVRAGNHFIDPMDVVGIRPTKKNIFIVKLRSDPNPQFPLWMKESEVIELLHFFDVKEAPPGT